MGVQPSVNTLSVKKRVPDDRIIAFAGNPNVGKSTLFNALTGMRQHTGNWAGKTVANAQGYCVFREQGYVLVDIPGTYSLTAFSAEEDIARDFICFGGADAVVVVCDATCLERNLNLVLQTLEVTGNAVVCVNLMDEARKKGVRIDLDALEARLGVPAVGTCARSGKGIKLLMERLSQLSPRAPRRIDYPEAIENALMRIQASFKDSVPNPRWVALKLLEGEADLIARITEAYGMPWAECADERAALEEARRALREGGLFDAEAVRDAVVGAIYRAAQDVCAAAVENYDPLRDKRRLKTDRLLTNRFTGTLCMLALLALVFYITITGSNYPSQWLSDGLFWVQDRLTELFVTLDAPQWLHGALVLGVYRVLAWVVSVMLPPMAIFFPLFTLLEDVGYLPRIAFNLDRSFRRCGACGKQALTMCMGFGCNAVGVSGCRIIGSTRERLIAILTNNFVPCNGRFPTLIAVLTMFFAGAAAVGSVLPALLLTAVILLGVGMTFVFSKLLSVTVLKGVPSAFTLEMPPYRKPQIGKIIVRSIFDRTLFVLRRAAIVAAPAGLLLWLMANITVGGTTVLHLCTSFLDPFARMLGMDGVILMAFILGFPANEIVLPIVLMAYTASGTLAPIGNLASLHGLLTANGWTWLTAVCVVLFSLMHWPCSTTLITVHKETKSAKWTFLSFLIPTAAGMLLCFLLTSAVRLLQLA